MRRDKQQAIYLRKSGKSYNEIFQLLRIPKSTLSTWLKELPISQFIKNDHISKIKKTWADNIIRYNKERARKARLIAESIEHESFKEIIGLQKIDLKLLGIALYWAEGYKRAKWAPFFCNSDPEMVKLMMRFFREICKVSEDRFRPQVQIHPNVSVEKAENYWSKITDLKKNSFLSPLMQISKSSRQIRPKRILPYGTFRLGVANAKVLYRLRGWMRGLAFIATRIKPASVDS